MNIINEQKKTKKHVLVLAGGELKGSFQVGALKAILEKENKHYDAIVANSVGALNAAFLVNYLDSDNPNFLQTTEKLEKFWIDHINSMWSIVKFWPLGVNLFRLLNQVFKGFFDSSPLNKLIYKYLDLNILLNSNTELWFNATNLNTSEEVFFNNRSNDKDLVKKLVASISTPFIMQPNKLTIDGETQFYYDGLFKHIAPVSKALELNPDEIDVILCQPETLTKNKQNYFKLSKLSKRALQLIEMETVRKDLDIGILQNHSRGSKILIRTYRPLEEVPATLLGNDWAIWNLKKQAKLIGQSIDMGYKTVKNSEPLEFTV